MLKEALAMLLASFPQARDVDLLPGVTPPLDTFGLNPEAATEVYRIEAFGSSIGDPVEDEVSITVEQDSIIHIEGRCNSCVGAGIASWTPYVGGTNGPSIDTEDGAGNPVSFPIVVASFVVTAGTYDVGIRADGSSAGIVTVTDRFITITVIKR